jgi:eukaryotic-like serine/threonine-protein kinase
MTAKANVLSGLQTTLGAAYTRERELGGGGMSRVFVATDASLARRVVVKALSAGTTTDGFPYYTMPFVEGRSRSAQ